MASSVRPASTAATPRAYQASASPGSLFTARHCRAFQSVIDNTTIGFVGRAIKAGQRVSGISQRPLIEHWEIHLSPEIPAALETSPPGQVIRASSDVEAIPRTR